MSSNNPQVCVYTFNMTPSSYGMRLRSGWREWSVGLDNGQLLHVGTIIPFKGADVGIGDDRLFAVTNEGIWDVSTEAVAPTLKVTFPNNTAISGFGVFTQYIDDGDNEFIYYADSANGLYIYDKNTDSWAAANQLDFEGVVVADINFVVVHKLRIWFATRTSSIGYYLPVGARTGTVNSFNFGIKFKEGGRLVGLYNYTVDGGDGVDDYLIALSSTGNVLPYRGSDPSQSDWALVGTYFVGAVARGSRCASQYGGNTMILSTYGLIGMDELLRGVEPRDPKTDTMGGRIAEFVRGDMRKFRADQGWDIKYLTSEGLIAIIVPKLDNGEYRQYVYQTDVSGWGFWRGIPATCMDSWNDTVYFGTEDGRVCSMDVSRDDISLTPPPVGVNGKDIEFSMLTNYQDLGSPGHFKRGKMIRPNFVSQSNVAFNAKFLYDYNVVEPFLNFVQAPTTASQWDIDVWDGAIWANTEFRIFDRIVGSGGIGRYVSVAIRGEGVSGTRLASIDVFWDQGGGL